jgi:hypothetical protein
VAFVLTADAGGGCEETKAGCGEEMTSDVGRNGWRRGGDSGGAEGVDASLRSSRSADVGEKARGARPERDGGEAVEPHYRRRWWSRSAAMGDLHVRPRRGHRR